MIYTGSEPTTVFSFRGPYAFLSNFYICSLEFSVDGRVYIVPSAEHIFHSYKTDCIEDKIRILTADSPLKAKRIGHNVKLIDNWSEQRVDFMRKTLDIKFAKPNLSTMLMDTGFWTLVEGNRWKDSFWGCAIQPDGTYVGDNILGVLLMEKRLALRIKYLYS